MGSALSVVTILAAEGQKSQTLFLVAGGALAAWAVVLAAIGLSQSEFPQTDGAKQGVMAISAGLVVLTLVAAVATSEKHHSEAGAKAAHSQESGGEPETPATTPTTPADGAEPPPTATTEPEPPAGGASGPIELAVGDGFAYDTTSLDAPAGKIEITFSNPGSIPHDVQIAEGDRELGGTKVFTGGDETFEVDLKAGKYTYFCSVPGHREAGMEGTLSVS